MAYLPACRNPILLAGGHRNANWLVFSRTWLDRSSGFWHGDQQWCCLHKRSMAAQPRAAVDAANIS